VIYCKKRLRESILSGEVFAIGKLRQRALSVACGAITFALIFYLVPVFLMRAVEDVIWGALMILLPVIPAVLLLHTVGGCSPKAVSWCFLTECLIALVFHREVGSFLGYRLLSWEWDLFDYIAYYMFTLGFSAAATLAQFTALYMIRKSGKK